MAGRALLTTKEIRVCAYFRGAVLAAFKLDLGKSQDAGSVLGHGALSIFKVKREDSEEEKWRSALGRELAENDCATWRSFAVAIGSSLEQLKVDGELSLQKCGTLAGALLTTLTTKAPSNLVFEIFRCELAGSLYFSAFAAEKRSK